MICSYVQHMHHFGAHIQFYISVIEYREDIGVLCESVNRLGVRVQRIVRRLCPQITFRVSNHFAAHICYQSSSNSKMTDAGLPFAIKHLLQLY
jgi:hypothetical protein